MMAARAGLVAILLAGSIASSLWGQRMLTIRERAPSGDTLPIGKSGIVDINGTLLIGINRDSLRTLAEARATSATAISDLLSRLDGVVRVRDAALAAIGPALDRWKASSKDSTAQAMFRDSLHKTSTLAQQVIDAAPRGSRLRDRLNLAFREALTRPGGLEDLYRIVFTVAGDEADALRVERDSLLKAAGVFVQVGGWSITGKGTRPLHFEGFDENPNLEDFEVERFGLGRSPSPSSRSRSWRGSERSPAPSTREPSARACRSSRETSGARSRTPSCPSSIRRRPVWIRSAARPRVSSSCLEP